MYQVFVLFSVSLIVYIVSLIDGLRDTDLDSRKLLVRICSIESGFNVSDLIVCLYTVLVLYMYIIMHVHVAPLMQCNLW